MYSITLLGRHKKNINEAFCFLNQDVALVLKGTKLFLNSNGTLIDSLTVGGKGMCVFGMGMPISPEK